MNIIARRTLVAAIEAARARTLVYEVLECIAALQLPFASPEEAEPHGIRVERQKGTKNGIPFDDLVIFAGPDQELVFQFDLIQNEATLASSREMYRPDRKFNGLLRVHKLTQTDWENSLRLAAGMAPATSGAFETPLTEEEHILLQNFGLEPDPLEARLV